MIRFGSGTTCTCSLEDLESAKEANRRYRRNAAKQFAKWQCSIIEGVRQHIVRSTGPELLLGDRMYYGVMLVAVYGMDSSICVVTKRNELDMTRVRGLLRKRPKHVVIGRIADAAISEIEDHAFDGDRETKPFGFVSVPASSSEYDEEKAIDFLTRKMQGDLATTFDATIKTSIWAFKHLCLKEVEAEELWVTAWEGPGHSRAESLLVNEIQDYMDIINDDGSGRGGSDLGGLDSRMDSDSDVEDPYVYSCMDVNSDMEDSYMDLDADRFATDQEREECLKLVGKAIFENKKVILPRQCGSIYFKFGGYRIIENVSITCVGTCGSQSWLEEWYDLMWVAVHGMESICMVVRYNDLDTTRVGPLLKGFSKGSVMYALTSTVLSDIEDLPDEKRESSGMIINVPFGVVSLNPDMAHMDHQKDVAVAFLEEKMRNGSVVTADETIQTTICALQHLCLEEVKAEDIYVCRQFGQIPGSLSMDEIKHHLQVINYHSWQ